MASNLRVATPPLRAPERNIFLDRYLITKLKRDADEKLD
jgi:hypothetical protein